MTRQISEEHRAAMVEGRRKSAQNKKDAAAEIDALRSELDALKQKGAQTFARADQRIDAKALNNSTLPPEPKGFQGNLHDSMRDLIQEQVQRELQRALPERDVRPQGRNPVRPAARIAYDRDGNILTRKKNTTDPFKIPDDLREADMDYQWVRISCHNQEDLGNQVIMQENGWRPIQSQRPRWEGRFMPSDYQGPIHNNGLMLMERPMILTEEAKEEEMAAVHRQARRQREQFGLQLPDGFSGATPAAKANTGIRVGKAEAMAGFTPSHELQGGMEY